MQQHAERDGRIGMACAHAEIDVEKPSLSISPKFAPIGMKTLSSPTRAVTSATCRSSGDRAMSGVVWKLRHARRIVHRHVVGRDEQVEPSVVVVVEETRSAKPRLTGDAGLLGGLERTRRRL